MLGKHDVGATLAVSEITAARRFYEETLGLTAAIEMGDGVIYASGNTRLLVYQSEFAGTNKATAATWATGSDFDAVIDDLRDKGVAFQHYDVPGATREGDIYVMDGMRGVWIVDPDGNILGIVDQ